MYNSRNKGEIMSKFIVVSGPSGVGKGTLIKMLQDKYAELNKKIYLL